MTDTNPKTTLRVSRRVRQFGILQIAALTTLIALLCIPLGFFLRSLPAEKRPRAILTVVLASVVCIVAFAIALGRRIHAERTAGPTQFRVPTAATKAFHATNLFSCAAFVVAASAVIYGFVTEAEWFNGLRSVIVQGPFWLVASATYLMSVWCGIDPTLIEFCESGLIRRSVHATPWTRFRGYRWGKIDPNELFLLQDGDFIQVPIGAEMRNAVEEQMAKAGLKEDPNWK